MEDATLRSQGPRRFEIMASIDDETSPPPAYSTSYDPRPSMFWFGFMGGCIGFLMGVAFGLAI